MSSDKIAVVLPVYNEEKVIEGLLSDIESYIKRPVEFILVNDGSTDNTLSVLREYKVKRPGSLKRVVSLSRNFGHQNALMCGLENVPADADRIIVMDSDRQDKPEDIPVLLAKMDEGYECVYAVRKTRHEGIALKLFTKIFYKLQTRIASFYIPRDAGVFSVLTRDVLEKILSFGETDIYFPALRAYVGYKQIGMPLDRGKRAHGNSRVGYKRLIDLSLIALLNFSAIPIRVIFVFGMLITAICAMASLTVLLLKIFGVTKIPGVTTILILMMSFAGIQIMFLGIVGEYIGKMFRETKKRPRWIVKEITR